MISPPKATRNGRRKAIAVSFRKTLQAFRWQFFGFFRKAFGRSQGAHRDGRAALFRQTTSFVGVGGRATAVHYLILITVVQVLGGAPVPAALLGYVFGGFISYTLNRRHTFASTRPHNEAIWRFAAVAGVGFVLTFLLMALFVDRWGRPYLLAQVVTTGIVMFWTFTANRMWTFADGV